MRHFVLMPLTVPLLNNIYFFFSMKKEKRKKLSSIKHSNDDYQGHFSYGHEQALSRSSTLFFLTLIICSCSQLIRLILYHAKRLRGWIYIEMGATFFVSYPIKYIICVIHITRLPNYLRKLFAISTSSIWKSTRIYC